MRISPVYINGFHQATYHPCPQENHMVTENNNSNKKASSEDNCFQRMCIFCLHSKWRLEGDDRQESSHHFQVHIPPNQNHHSLVLSPSHYPTRLQQKNGNVVEVKGNGMTERKALTTGVQLLVGKTEFLGHRDYHSVSNSKHFTTTWEIENFYLDLPLPQAKALF